MQPTTKTPTIAQFERFCKAHGALAVAVLEAQALAQLTHRKVSAYIAPILADAQLRGEQGELLTDRNRLYLCDNEAAVIAFYARCETAHKAAGYNLPKGVWPDLVAESRHIDAQNALLEAGCSLFGIKATGIYGANRERMLRLLIGACSESFPKPLRSE